MTEGDTIGTRAPIEVLLLHRSMARTDVVAGIEAAQHVGRLCAAIVDRLTFNGTIIETGAHPYCLAHSR